MKRTMPEYAKGKIAIDVNVLASKFSIDDLRIGAREELSEEAVEGEEGTTERPGGCDPKARR
jgi:hypothetical protein